MTQSSQAGKATCVIGHILLCDNGITGCGSSGMWLGTTEDALICHNLLEGCYDRIYLSSSDNNLIRGNRILNNLGGNSGVHLNSSCEQNGIHCNTIDGNLGYGVRDANSCEDVDARNDCGEM